MKLHCEYATRLIIPAIRALVAIRLAKRYGLSQLEIAKRLGVSQPAISYYLHFKRGKIAVNKLKKDVEIMRLIDQLTDLIYRNERSELLQDMICKICRKARKVLVNYNKL